MAKIVITGANGFIGKNLVAGIEDSITHEIFPITRDNGDIGEAKTWQAIPTSDVVVHLAARSFVPNSWIDPSEFLATNLMGTINALEFCRQHQSRLIFLSSYLYGDPESLPIDENNPVIASNPYMLSKKMAEEICYFYAQYYDIPTTIFRPFNIIGAGQDQNFLVPSIIRQACDKGIVYVKDVEPRRDYLHINDLVSALLCAIETHRKFDIFNIASGLSYSVQEVIDIVAEIIGESIDIEAEGDRRINEIMDTRADISKAKNLLGWRPSLTLKASLQLIVEEHRKHRPKS